MCHSDCLESLSLQLRLPQQLQGMLNQCPSLARFLLVWTVPANGRAPLSKISEQHKQSDCQTMLSLLRVSKRHSWVNRAPQSTPYLTCHAQQQSLTDWESKYQVSVMSRGNDANVSTLPMCALGARGSRRLVGALRMLPGVISTQLQLG